jgi:sirohydrochlorin ferrochelatase
VLTLATRPAMASPLLLLVHGRAAGVVPGELMQLAAELTARRGAPVLLQALTAAGPPVEGVRQALAGGADRLSLVPLMLLPGAHVRVDLPAIAAFWRASLEPQVALWRLPFVGAWPSWQRALRAELVQLGPGTGEFSGAPLLLHHPIEGGLAARYLQHLARVTGARCQATPYSAQQLAELQLTLTAPALPLALAANRLTDSLAEVVGPPLLQRPRFRQLLLERLEALP